MSRQLSPLPTVSASHAPGPGSNTPFNKHPPLLISNLYSIRHVPRILLSPIFKASAVSRSRYLARDIVYSYRLPRHGPSPYRSSTRPSYLSTRRTLACRTDQQVWNRTLWRVPSAGSPEFDVSEAVG